MRFIFKYFFASLLFVLLLSYTNHASYAERGTYVSAKETKKIERRITLKRARSKDGRFIDHGDGTIIDTKTDLMWTKKDSYADFGKCLDWNDSRSYVSRLNTGGYSDWRLPTVKELKTINERSKKITAGVTVFFLKVEVHLDPIFASGSALSYWSSEETGSCCARVVFFSTGLVDKYRRGLCFGKGVRAVRR